MLLEKHIIILLLFLFTDYIINNYKLINIIVPTTNLGKNLVIFKSRSSGLSL